MPSEEEFNEQWTDIALACNDWMRFASATVAVADTVAEQFRLKYLEEHVYNQPEPDESLGEVELSTLVKELFAVDVPEPGKYSLDPTASGEFEGHTADLLDKLERLIIDVPDNYMWGVSENLAALKEKAITFSEKVDLEGMSSISKLTDLLEQAPQIIVGPQSRYTKGEQPLHYSLGGKYDRDSTVH